jgi:hypothetical protein
MSALTYLEWGGAVPLNTCTESEQRWVHPRSATYRLLPGTNKCVRAASTDAKASRRSCALHGESASVRGAGRVGRRHNTHPERAQPHPLRCKKECEERRRAADAVTLSASEFTEKSNTLPLRTHSQSPCVLLCVKKQRLWRNSLLNMHRVFVDSRLYVCSNMLPVNGMLWRTLFKR